MSDATWLGVTSSTPGPGDREGAGAHNTATQRPSPTILMFTIPYQNPLIGHIFGSYKEPSMSLYCFCVCVCVSVCVCLCLSVCLSVCVQTWIMSLSGSLWPWMYHESIRKLSWMCHECVMNVSWIMESRKSHRRVMKLSRGFLTNNIERSFHWTKIHEFICLLE